MNKVNNKVIILGNEGFVGKHIEKYLRSRGIAVQGCDMPEVDLTQQKAIEQLTAIFDSSCSVIFLSCIKKEHGDDFETFGKNTQMVANVCAALEKKAVRQVIYFSSAAVYGEEVHNLSITENTAISPTSNYGLAKFVGERMLAAAAEKKSVKLVCIRPPVIYGPGDRPCYGPSGFCSAAKQKQPITLWGDGTELREFIYIDDMVKIVSSLLECDYDGPLNIAQGKSITFAEIIQAIEKHKGKLQVHTRERTKKKVDNAFDNRQFNKLFPRFQFTPIDKGVMQLLEAP